MTSMRQLSLVLCLISTGCGLRSPFSGGSHGSGTGGDSASGGGARSGTDGSSSSDGSGAGASRSTGAAGGAGLDTTGAPPWTVGSAGANGFGSNSGAAAGSGAGAGAGAGSAATSGNGGPADAATGAGAASGSLGSDGGSSSGGATSADGTGHADPDDADGGLSNTIMFPDGGVITYPDDPTVPSPQANDPEPDGTDPDGGTGGRRGGQDLIIHATDGCGEPAACFMQMSILTLSGHTYTAAFSSSYPKDNCARDVLDEDGDGNKDTIFIGDTFRSVPADECSFGSPFLSVAFFIDWQTAYRSLGVAQTWKTHDGFRSEWQIANGRAADNGSYYPLPGAISRLQLWGILPYSEGRTRGQLQVPLINNDNGSFAVGYVDFRVSFR